MDKIDELKVESIVQGYCEHHLEFEKERDKLLEIQEDKMMDIWKMTKGELYKIVLDSQEVVLGHINGLKDMVTNFLSTTARSTERHEIEIEKINKRLLQMETRFYALRNKENENPKE